MTILELIQADGFPTKKKASTRGGEFSAPCAWCGGTDRFLCWPNQGEFGRYWCRGCGRSGDAIQYLRDYRGFTYPEACAYLGREITRLSSPGANGRSKEPQWEPRATAAPGDLWQAKARKLVEGAVYNLWSSFGKPMLDFLTEQRGLTETTIKKFSLGFLPLDRWEAAPDWGLEEILRDNGKPKKLWFPRGLAIPLCDGDQVLRVRIRRPKSDGDPRYYLLRGSDTRAMVLGTDRSVSILVESELDALILYQEAGDLVNVVALGNAQTRPDQHTADLLNRNSLILMALDDDHAGAAECQQWWKGQYPQARRWPPVSGKDPGDMMAARVNIRTWVEAALIEYSDIGTQPGPPFNLAAMD
ncbi:MAG: hypothetical protein FJ135_15150, partial [Deltaproteobacteria bacterium]|nr:hypothetical protein [Deltaproteobacteria bacterium]